MVDDDIFYFKETSFRENGKKKMEYTNCISTER